MVLAGSGPRERERPAITPAPPAGLLERGFSAFRRPPAADDAPPADALSGYDDVDARLVLDESGTRVWLVGMVHGRMTVWSVQH